MKKFITLLFVTLSFYTVIAQENKEITLSDIWLTRKFAAKSWKDIIPARNPKNFYVLEDNKINIYDFQSASFSKTFVDGSLVKYADKLTIEIESFEINNAENKILIATETEPIYRRSSKSNYVIYDVKTGAATPLSLNGKQQLATFSPDGNKIAFVRDNNIFVVDLSGNLEIQITNDGKFNSIINGAPDWVYEEEFEFAQGYQWSPDGSKIAFMKFDESKVKEYNMQMWGDLYPQDYRYKYPKAGEDNSFVSVHIYHVDTKKTINVDLGTEKDQYIPRIYFPYNDVLSVLRMNRRQSTMDVLHANVMNGSTISVYHEENPRYIDLSNFTLHYLEKQRSFLISSEKDQWNHLYQVNLATNKMTQLTKGNWEVVSVSGIDEVRNNIYYMSTETGSTQRQLFSISYDGKFIKKRITTDDGSDNVVFNSDFTYYVDEYSSANVPPIISVCKSSGKLVKILEDNSALRKMMQEYGFQKQEFFQMKTTDSVALNGFMIKPAGFNPDKKYPVLMVFYGGPGSQEVNDRWGYSDFLWHQMLSQKGYMVVCVDGRGTGYKGEEFKKCTYLQLGKWEVNDQIEVAKYLSKFNFVDKARIGVWGWSFGGYLSTLCMTKGADYFKAGIAVAPVTNWRFYDNIYTERFMRKPSENASGYDENSPINFVKQLKGKYLLVHGSADDNVHVQNSYQLMDALVKNNKQFDMHFYTNKNHSIYGGYTRFHLYTRLTDFILNNL